MRVREGGGGGTGLGGRDNGRQQTSCGDCSHTKASVPRRGLAAWLSRGPEAEVETEAEAIRLGFFLFFFSFFFYTQD